MENPTSSPSPITSSGEDQSPSNVAGSTVSKIKNPHPLSKIEIDDFTHYEATEANSSGDYVEKGSLAKFFPIVLGWAVLIGLLAKVAGLVIFSTAGFFEYLDDEDFLIIYVPLEYAGYLGVGALIGFLAGMVVEKVAQTTRVLHNTWGLVGGILAALVGYFAWNMSFSNLFEQIKFFYFDNIGQNQGFDFAWMWLSFLTALGLGGLLGWSGVSGIRFCAGHKLIMEEKELKYLNKPDAQIAVAAVREGAWSALSEYESQFYDGEQHTRVIAFYCPKCFDTYVDVRVRWLSGVDSETGEASYTETLIESRHFPPQEGRKLLAPFNVVGAAT